VARPQGAEREAARAQRDDEWGLGALVEAERTGEGCGTKGGRRSMSRAPNRHETNKEGLWGHGALKRA
jgi:hypothetical protein